MSGASWSDWSQAIEGLRDLAGEWWIVTPFFTRPDALPDVPNTRVLTTAPAHKLATNELEADQADRALDALESLVRRGAQVRLSSGLHAKVYLRRTGANASGYFGSANLTKKATQNAEVMSGLTAFDAAFLAKLDNLWRDATKLDLVTVERLRSEARAARKELAAYSGTVPNVIVFALEREYGDGSFSITHARLGTESTEKKDRYVPGRVAYLSNEIAQSLRSLVRKRIDALCGRRRTDTGALARWLPDSPNMFVAHADFAEVVRAALRDLEAELQQKASKLAREYPTYEENFITRLHSSLKRYNVDDERKARIEAEARSEYRHVLHDGQVRLEYHELRLQWPDIAHPWYPVLTELVDPAQQRLLDVVASHTR